MLYRNLIRQESLIDLYFCIAFNINFKKATVKDFFYDKLCITQENTKYKFYDNFDKKWQKSKTF